MGAVKRDDVRCIKLDIDQGFHNPLISHAPPTLKAWVDELLKSSAPSSNLSDTPISHKTLFLVTSAISTVNRGLAPPLHISRARVLILKDDQEIPISNKGAIFRKLEAIFGEQVAQFLSRSEEG